MVILSTWRRKIALMISVQIGVVEAIGETATTGPRENAKSMRRTASVSKNPETKNGQNARRSQSNFSLQIGVT
jgi:hypothetical protein